MRAPPLPFDFFPAREPLRDAERFFPFFLCDRFVDELVLAAGTAGTDAPVWGLRILSAADIGTSSRVTVR